MTDFENPRCLVPPDLLDYLGMVRVRRSLRIPEPLRQKWPGVLKVIPEDFVVTEPVPSYPGLAELFSKGIAVPPHRMLTVTTETDMPGLRTDQDLRVEYRKRKVPAVAGTMVKKGETTWRVTDMIAKHLSEQLDRKIHHGQIRTSGLKDGRAVTVQTFVIIGVSMSDMKRVDWSGFELGRRGFFVKDLRPTDRLIDQGDHLVNGFEIKVRIPGKTEAEIHEYLECRFNLLRYLRFLVPNGFHLQRLGPTQDNQKWGRTLLTGDYQPPKGCHPFSTNAQAMMFQALCGQPTRSSEESRELRRQLESCWQYRFEEMERLLRSEYKKHNLTLEYEMARRFADPKYRGSADAILYDLRDRLSIAIGAWQAVYWNWSLASQLKSGKIEPDIYAAIPLAFSCDQARDFYSRMEHGRQCLSELAVTEELAAAAEPYMQAFGKHYWERMKHEADQPDQTGLSSRMLHELMRLNESFDGITTPTRRELSAALVRHLFLIPRDFKTGLVKDWAPTRRAFMKPNNFQFSCEDGAATLRFALRSGSYATMLIGMLFDTSDPEEVPGIFAAREMEVDGDISL